MALRRVRANAILLVTFAEPPDWFTAVSVRAAGEGGAEPFCGRS